MAEKHNKAALYSKETTLACEIARREAMSAERSASFG